MRKNKKQGKTQLPGEQVTITAVETPHAVVPSTSGGSNLREYVPDKNHILEVRTISGNTFKNMLDTLKAVLNEANFVFTEEGLKLRAVDSERHALVDVFMHASSFEFYHCKERQVLGVDIDLLQKTLKCNKLNDLMCFIRHQDDPHVLEVSFENFQNGTKVSDRIKLMNLPEYKITDELEYRPPMEMDSHSFQSICREMAGFHATLIEIQSIGDELIFMNKDGMTRRRVVVRISPGEETETKTVREPARGVFLLKFLKSFAKAASLSPRVRIFIKTDSPLITEYAINNTSTLKFLLGSEEH
jgi:proliferating cell nuclear antigen